MKFILIGLSLVAALVIFLTSCKTKTPSSASETTAVGPLVLKQPTEDTNLPEWARNDNIYEVNIRQYTPEGTLAAFAEHLPRLRDMGVDILWFMPIHEISMTNRKATPDLSVEDIEDPEERAKALGSYYAVSDYRGVNPEFGTKEEFKALIKQAHSMDMRVILDWVPNHTGWDHPWITEHPDYYTQDSTGKIIDPIDDRTGKSWGWTDVADLNYDNPNMREAMVQDMLYWINDADVDGFRVDVAHAVPDDFWDATIPRLRNAKDGIFMLAESNHAHHRNASGFNMDYGWTFHHLLNEIVKGEKNLDDLRKWAVEDREKYNKGFHMYFITNHDENTWQGTEYERLGDGVDAGAVLCYTIDGMPLVYTGQEAAFNRRFKFFQKDSTDWGTFEKTDLYTTLNGVKHRNKALWNGYFGGDTYEIPSGSDSVLAYTREKDGDKVIVAVNFGNSPQDITLDNEKYHLDGDYTEIFDKQNLTVREPITMTLPAWSYKVWSNK